MKQVDFYLITNSVKQARFKLASRLASKMQKLGKSLLVVTDSDEQTQQLDELMWAYSDTSFVAHESLANVSDMQQTCTIHIGEQKAVNAAVIERSYDVLLNLCDEVPVFNHHFNRIAEIIEADENSKTAGRKRYKHYQSEGFELKMHELSL